MSVSSCGWSCCEDAGHLSTCTFAGTGFAPSTPAPYAQGVETNDFLLLQCAFAQEI
jgi:hypothetical protein